jgi:phosphoribosyl 1,2-cyclic phosphodiesterase
MNGTGNQRGIHYPGCTNSRCTGCMPEFPVLPGQHRLVPLRPSVEVPVQVAPSAKLLLLAFYEWLNAQPSEALADPKWTPERLVDMFILEANN